MARNKTLVSNAELAALRERAYDLGADLREVATRIRTALEMDADVITPAAYAAAFGGLASAASDLATAINLRLGHDEDRRRIEAELKARS